MIEIHRHTGLDQPRVNYQDLDNLPATDFLYSFLSPFRDADSTTIISTDDFDNLPSYENTTYYISIVGGTGHYQKRLITTDWAAADWCWGIIKQGDYVYALFRDDGTAPDTFRIYRYAKDDLASGGTIMTFSGTAPDFTTNSTLRFCSDGTNFYINYDGGNSANAYVLAKYTVSGTVFTYDSSITCGSATKGFNKSFAVLQDGSIYTIDPTDVNISKFDSTGTLAYTDTVASLNAQLEMIMNFENILYSFDTTKQQFIKLYYS